MMHITPERRSSDGPSLDDSTPRLPTVAELALGAIAIIAVNTGEVVGGTVRRLLSLTDQKVVEFFAKEEAEHRAIRRGWGVSGKNLRIILQEPGVLKLGRARAIRAEILACGALGGVVTGPGWRRRLAGGAGGLVLGAAIVIAHGISQDVPPFNDW